MKTKTITYVASGLWFLIMPMMLGAVMSEAGCPLLAYLLADVVIIVSSIVVFAEIIIMFDLFDEGKDTELERRNKEL